MAEPSDSPTYKVIELKILIHCRGCMKKIEKIIRKTGGVVDTTINPSLNKVTLKATVDSDVVISRLAKYGKHAELWPQPKPSSTKNDNNRKAEEKKEKIIDSTKPKEQSENSSPTIQLDKDPDDKNNKKDSAAEKSSAAEQVNKPVDKEVPEKKKSSTKEEPTKPAETKAEQTVAQPEKQGATLTESPAVKADRNPPTSEENKEKNHDGIGDNQKGNKVDEERSEQRKVKQPNDHADDQTNDRAVPIVSKARTSDDTTINYNFGINDNNSYPVHPPYVMSYSMSQPTASQSYYAYPMQTEPQGYMYNQYSTLPQEYYYGSIEGNSSYGSRYRYNSNDGMNMFDEEDPNSCSVM